MHTKLPRKHRGEPAAAWIAPEARSALSWADKHTGCRPATQKITIERRADGSLEGGSAMAEKPYDRLDGVIWYDGKLVPWGDATLHVLSHGLHYASSVFEGERAYGGAIYKCTEHSERLEAIGATARLRDSLLGCRDRCSETAGAGKERPGRCLCAAGRVARFGDDGRLRTEQQDPSRHRHLAMAELFRPGATTEGHPTRSCGLSTAGPCNRAGARQGRWSLHDLHDLQAQGRAQRLCRCNDAGLAGTRGRMHRRQYLLHRGRQDPYSDRGLLPRRHYPAHVRSSWRRSAASR